MSTQANVAATSPSRAVVVGGGSIGVRHARNLLAAKLAQVVVVEPDAARRTVIAEELPAARVAASLDEALATRPTIGVIASPSHLHVPAALALARAGIDFMVEKPLSHDNVGIDELLREVAERKLITLVGCNMRFHPGPARVKELLVAGAVGRVHYARIHCSSYLPEWRPWQDYRKSYSANAGAGGGVILDCIHEIDLACHYLGPATRVTCAAGHVSALELDVEDTAMLALVHTGGAMSSVHLDYVERDYDRGCKIVGDDGTLVWSFGAPEVRQYVPTDKTWTVHPLPTSWQVNDMYADELRHFLSCVASRANTTLPVHGGARVLALALAAKRAAASGTAVNLEESTS